MFQCVFLWVHSAWMFIFQASWMFIFMSLIKFRKCSVIISSNILFALFFLLFLRSPQCICCSAWSHPISVLGFVHFPSIFSFLLPRLVYFHWCILKFIDISSVCSNLCLNLSSEFFILVIVVNPQNGCLFSFCVLYFFISISIVFKNLFFFLLLH